MTTFSEGKERNIALGVWGAVGGFGAAAGVLLGGVFTDLLSWEWIFFLNIPVGLAALALAPVLLAESRDARTPRASTPSARCSSPAASRRPCLGITQANDWGWSSGEDDRRLRGRRRPARRLRRPRAPHGRPADVVLDLPDQDGQRARTSPGFILGTALFSMFLMLTLYMQQVLGYSPLKTGVAYIAVAGGVDRLGDGRPAARHAGRRQAGARHRDEPAHGRAPVLHAGLAPTARTSATSCRASCHRAGHGVLVRLRSRSRRSQACRRRRPGIASGLINTSQQIGGALGIAVLSSVAVAHTTERDEGGRRGAAGVDLGLPGGVLGRRGDRCWSVSSRPSRSSARTSSQWLRRTRQSRSWPSRRRRRPDVSGRHPDARGVAQAAPLAVLSRRITVVIDPALDDRLEERPWRAAPTSPPWGSTSCAA